MRNWAFNILINVSKKNPRRRHNLLKYFDIYLYGVFNSTHRVYDIEAFTDSHSGIVYEDLNVDDYEPIDWYT